MDIKKFYLSQKGKIEEIKIKNPYLDIDSPSVLYGYNIFETIGVKNKKILFLDEHLQRLNKGIIFFKFDVEIEKITEILNLIIDKISSGILRLTLFKEKRGTLIYIKFTHVKDYDSLSLSKSAFLYEIRSDFKSFQTLKTGNFILYHHSQIVAEENDCDTSLLKNNKDEIIEFSYGNILFEECGNLYTPPLSVGCIDGIMRKFLLKYKIASEKKLNMHNLENIKGLYLINSVREIVPIKKLIGKKFKIKFKNENFRKFKEIIKSRLC